MFGKHGHIRQTFFRDNMADRTKVAEMVSLVTENTKVRVSSVLNRDSSQYGKKFMFDKHEDTCWNSDQGSPQFVILEFSEESQVKEIQIQFQGGFVGKECTIEGGPSSSSLTPFHEFYPDDSNTQQTFFVNSSRKIKVLKIIFTSSTDLFGRIIVYKLDVLGGS